MMDHKTAYAHHIAQAIRHKKAMKADAAIGESLEIPDVEEFEGDEDPPLAPADPKAARKERLKEILSR